jgi:hypothetical protein
MMRVELRPDPEVINRSHQMPILDEAVIEGACSVHAEMMDDRTLWIGVEGADGRMVTLVVGVEPRTHTLRLFGEDQGGSREVA